VAEECKLRLQPRPYSWSCGDTSENYPSIGKAFRDTGEFEIEWG